jgi:hypothetical protein
LLHRGFNADFMQRSFPLDRFRDLVAQNLETKGKIPKFCLEKHFETFLKDPVPATTGQPAVKLSAFGYSTFPSERAVQEIKTALRVESGLHFEGTTTAHACFELVPLYSSIWTGDTGRTDALANVAIQTRIPLTYSRR